MAGREEKRELVGLGYQFFWFSTHDGGGSISTALTKTVEKPQSPGATTTIYA
jgi:hypothetical protein